MKRELHEANRRSWDAATRAHNAHKRDQAAHLRAGGSTLFPEERALCGPLDGRRLLHLQCNSGQDTLSLAALGARATGVDISDEAISFARRLAEESGIAAEFVRADLYDWLEAADGRFDLVFSSYGAYGWLSDLGAWARGIARVLVPGGRLVLIDFHPLPMILDEQWRLALPYSTGGEAIAWSAGVTDYVARSGAALGPSGFDPAGGEATNPHPCYEFGWGLGEIVSALLDAGLALRGMREYPYANGCRLWDGMRELSGNRFAPPASVPQIPLMFSLVAERP